MLAVGMGVQKTLGRGVAAYACPGSAMFMMTEPAQIRLQVGIPPTR